MCASVSIDQPVASHATRSARVIQAGKLLRFSLEPGQPIGIFGKRLGQDRQCHLVVQLGIGGLPNLSHAALADEGGHVVVAESGADLKGHELL